MFSMDIPTTVEQARERLENYSLVVAQKATETRCCGMQEPTQPGRLHDDLYNSIKQLLDRRLGNLYLAPKAPKDYRKRPCRRECARAKRSKGKPPNQEDNLKLESKFNLDSEAFLSILNFAPINAKPITNPESIVTANRPIFHTHTDTIQLNTKVGTGINLPCVVCPATGEIHFESLISVFAYPPRCHLRPTSCLRFSRFMHSRHHQTPSPHCRSE